MYIYVDYMHVHIYVHILLQFNGFLTTAESLFCILNGDDLYSTFEGTDARFTLADSIRLFSKFYLCLFIFLFIYVVLSLFIGIFNHAYESLSVSSLLYINTVAIMYYCQLAYIKDMCIYSITQTNYIATAVVVHNRDQPEILKLSSRMHIN